MKITMTFPGGRRICIERQPYQPERFRALCATAGCLGGAALFVRLLLSV